MKKQNKLVKVIDIVMGPPDDWGKPPQDIRKRKVKELKKLFKKRK